jgi:hypothetical protein
VIAFITNGNKDASSNSTQPPFNTAAGFEPTRPENREAAL